MELTRQISMEARGGLILGGLDYITSRAFYLAGLGHRGGDVFNCQYAPDCSRFINAFKDFPQDASTTVLEWALVHGLVHPGHVMQACEPGTDIWTIRSLLITLSAFVEYRIAQLEREAAVG